MSSKIKVKAGNVEIGGGAPISVQSMVNVPSTDIEGSVRQCVELEKAGCQIIRIAIPNMEAVSLIEPIKKAVDKDKHQTWIDLPPIFTSNEEYLAWKAEKNQQQVSLVPLESVLPNEKVYLGIDSGSTTTKIVLMNEREEIIYTYYVHNEGDPIVAVQRGLAELEKQCKEKNVDLHITAGCSTGYGEDLIRMAFSLDYSMIETMAHYMAARRMSPKVSFILDIGGQDMKAIYVNHGVLTRMEINEACSSGCGSFIENFAQTLDLPIEQFVAMACESERPSDLGTRCTVFMNSKVKQVLREGATASDIAAGLAYSVVKNCLFKVLKIKNYEELGDNIVLQGGTMRNDAVVKAFENLTGKKVYCNNIPELMGAYGCALYAKHQSKDQTVSKNLSDYTQITQAECSTLTCHGCVNQCQITCYKFPSGNRYYSGNKCERIFNNGKSTQYKGVNMSAVKYSMLFDRAKQDENAPKNPNSITIGIPRVLNMYEEFPFWHTLFTACGLNVVLSETSTYSKYEQGVHTVMSDNICFPAKLVHSHIYELDANEQVDRIFFPRVMYERAEDKGATSSLNCPIVIGYPDVVKSSIQTTKPIDSPVISFVNKELLIKQLEAYLQQFNIPKKTVARAVQLALDEQEKFGKELRQKNQEVFEKTQKEGRLCLLLAGRPYHTDPLVQHKLSEMMVSLGVDVITEEIVRNADIKERESFILKQWTYVNRILNAAQWVAQQNNLVHIVQTTSFGCGPDAFLLDEVRAVVNLHNKALTLLKVDDINNVGSMKLRVRSLIDSLQLGIQEDNQPQAKPFVKPARFEKGDNERRTILAPFFTEYLSPLMASAFEYAGYKLEQLPMGDAEQNELGLRYANNEVCYPATLIVGGFIKALQSGKYDLDKTAISITQLGKCRATNYTALIRRAVVEAGFSQVPVIGIGGDDNADNPGFHFNYMKVAPIVMVSTFFTDWLSVFYHAIAVREKEKGAARRLREDVLQRANPLVKKGDTKGLIRLLGQAADEFNQIPIYTDKTYPKVGITGEIFLKFNPYSHKYVPDWLMAHGVEVIPSAVHNFFLRSFVNFEYNRKKNLIKPKLPSVAIQLLWKYIHHQKVECEKVASRFRFYQPFDDIFTLASYGEQVVSLSAQFGEGWLLPAEVIGFIKQGCNNVVSMQPFGCIANHIVAKKKKKKLKTLYPQLNMLSLDFDGGVSETNIANRLLLFLGNMV